MGIFFYIPYGGKLFLSFREGYFILFQKIASRFYRKNITVPWNADGFSRWSKMLPTVIYRIGYLEPKLLPILDKQVRCTFPASIPSQGRYSHLVFESDNHPVNPRPFYAASFEDLWPLTLLTREPIGQNFTTKYFASRFSLLNTWEFYFFSFLYYRIPTCENECNVHCTRYFKIMISRLNHLPCRPLKSPGVTLHNLVLFLWVSYLHLLNRFYLIFDLFGRIDRKIRYLMALFLKNWVYYPKGYVHLVHRQ